MPALQHLFEGTAWLLTAGFLHQGEPNLRDAAATGAGIGLDAANRAVDAEIDAIVSRAKAAQVGYEAQVGGLRNADVPDGPIKSIVFRANRFIELKKLGIANDIRRLKVFGEAAYLGGLRGAAFAGGLGISFLNGYFEQEDRDLARGLPPEYVTARKVVRGAFEIIGDFVGFVGGASACAVGTGWVGTLAALECGAVGAQWVSQGANGLTDWGFDRIDEALGFK